MTETSQLDPRQVLFVGVDANGDPHVLIPEAQMEPDDDVVDVHYFDWVEGGFAEVVIPSSPRVEVGGMVHQSDIEGFLDTPAMVEMYPSLANLLTEALQEFKGEYPLGGDQ